MKRIALALLISWGAFTGTAQSALSSPEVVQPNIFVQLAKKVVPSVVNISTLSTVKSPMMQGNPDDLFRHFFEDFLKRHGGGRGFSNPNSPNPPNPNDDEGDESDGPLLPKAMSLGTGFIIDASGLILTNNHVVADADEIKIYFTESEDEKPIDGEVVGRDTELDVALIRVKTKREMIPMVLGDSDALEVGEYVFAVGNPFGQGHSVTHGIISAKGRLAPDFPLANYLQTDAPINPGNSGGPLVNLKGEVIGINNAIDQRAQGIGFAIPINVVKKILPQLRTKGIVSRGYLGVLVEPLTPEIAAKIGLPPALKDLKAPFVVNVYPGEPADQAGIKPYDVILEFNQKPVRSHADLIGSVTGIPVGQQVPVKISRAGKEMALSVKIGQRPGNKVFAQGGPGSDSGKKKKEKQPPHINVGMTLSNLTAELSRDLGLTEKINGVVVMAAEYGGPADKSGLMRGDLILEVDRKVVKNTDDFYSLVKEKKSYLLRVRRLDPQGNEAYSVVVLDLKG